MSNAEQMWQKFIAHLQEIEPIREAPKKKGDKPVMLLHVNLIGSVAKYKKIFLAANKG